MSASCEQDPYSVLSTHYTAEGGQYLRRFFTRIPRRPFTIQPMAKPSAAARTIQMTICEPTYSTYSSRAMNSMRRFFCRPSSVELSAIGRVSP